MNNRIFKNCNIKPFPMIEIWKDLLKTNQLYGIESVQDFYVAIDDTCKTC